MADNRKQEISKKQIRTEVLAKRDALSEIQRKAAAESVYNQVIADPLFIKANRGLLMIILTIYFHDNRNK